MYENMYYEAIKSNILSKIQGIDKQEGSFVDNMVSPISMELESVYVELEKILSTMFLEDIVTENLEKRCAEYGLFRKKGTYAEGTATFTGTEDTVIPKDSLISTNTGLNFITKEEKTIATGSTMVDINIKAVDVGTKYNVEPNAVNTICIGINNIISVTNKEKTTGGTNIETDKELLNRLLLRLCTPATSGNKEHYRLWALEVDGIEDAKIFPLWNGNGTVQVLPITTDKKVPNQTIINNVIIKIEENRPIGATVTVIPPTEIKIDVEATITLKLNANLEVIKNTFAEKFTEYIAESVNKSSTVDYNKCLSLFYTIEGVNSVTSLKINGNTTNINIGEKEIQVAGTINITI